MMHGCTTVRTDHCTSSHAHIQIRHECIVFKWDTIRHIYWLTLNEYRRKTARKISQAMISDTSWITNLCIAYMRKKEDKYHLQTFIFASIRIQSLIWINTYLFSSSLHLFWSAALCFCLRTRDWKWKAFYSAGSALKCYGMAAVASGVCARESNCMIWTLQNERIASSQFNNLWQCAGVCMCIVASVSVYFCGDHVCVCVPALASNFTGFEQHLKVNTNVSSGAEHMGSHSKCLWTFFACAFTIFRSVVINSKKMGCLVLNAWACHA